MTDATIGHVRRPATLWTVVLMMLVAGWLPLASIPVAAVTEYRFEPVPSTPVALDLKGVSWASDGSEAHIVGGVQALLRYDVATGRATSAGNGNWSTSSQTLEAVVHTADGRIFISGGMLDASTVKGALWELVGDNVVLRATVQGDIIQGLAVSSTGRLLAIGALGSLFEYRGGELEPLGSVGDVVLHDIVWAPDGSGAMVVGAPGSITWFDAGEGTLTTVPFTSTHPLYAVDWRPGTGDAWAVGEGGLVVEVNSSTLDTARLRPYTPRTESILGIAWHPEGNIALLVGEEGVTYLWRMGVFTKQIVDVKKVLLDVEWDPVGDEALVAGESGTLLRYVPRVTPPNLAPNAVISSPEDGLQVEEGTVVTFDGSTSSDPDDDPLAFSWHSNGSGPLGRAAVVTATLPIGTHRVTLNVDDGQGHNSTDEVTVVVVRPVPPEDRLHIEVTNPRPGAVLKGETVISGTAAYELGTVASVEVSFDGEGWRPATGVETWSLSFDTSLLADGAHGLSVKATASDGVHKVVSLQVEVRNAVVPEPPEVPNITLNLRDRGLVDEPLEFRVSGGDLSSWLVVWSFGDGSSGQGSKVHHAYKEPGRYEVTLQLWLEGDEHPSAVFTATVIVDSGEPTGLSLEALMVLSLVAAGAIYVAGFYGGRRAFRRH